MTIAFITVLVLAVARQAVDAWRRRNDRLCPSCTIVVRRRRERGRLA